MHCPYCWENTISINECRTCKQPTKNSDFLWWMKLCQYNYNVKLDTYIGNTNYPGFFKGCYDYRESTMRFEDHFRECMSQRQCQVAPFIEVVYWKMYSQRGRAEIRVNSLINHLFDMARATTLKNAIVQFVTTDTPSEEDAKFLISA